MSDISFSCFSERSARKPGSCTFQGSHCVHRSHKIVDKDFYRLNKVEQHNNKNYERRQQTRQQGKCQQEPAVYLGSAKYAEPLGVISRQYSRAEVPDDRLYMIDKVARIRVMHDRFGIDHSEVLNYEIDQTNRARDEHMNSLVYKEKAVASQASKLSEHLKSALQIDPQELLLIGTDDESSLKKDSTQADPKTQSVRSSRPSYKEWLKQKDAEKRLKRKLTTQAQDEVRQQLLVMSQQEQRMREQRLKQMDKWLEQKAAKVVRDASKVEA